jgi:hypothetical protein
MSISYTMNRKTITFQEENSEDATKMMIDIGIAIDRARTIHPSGNGIIYLVKDSIEVRWTWGEKNISYLLAVITSDDTDKIRRIFDSEKRSNNVQ